jgi:hypothetical protein
LARETEVLAENLPQCRTTKCTCCPEANPGRRGGKPAINRLSHGTPDYGSYLHKLIAVKAQSKAHIIFTVPKFGLQVQIKLERWENAFLLFCVAFRMRLCDGPIFRPRSSIKCLYIFKTWKRDTLEFIGLSFNTRRQIIIKKGYINMYFARFCSKV